MKEKMMKRIVAAFEKKVESCKAERKMKRVMRSIDIAKDNALDAIEAIECQKSELVEGLPEITDFDSFVGRLSALMDEQEAQKAVVERLEAIKAYLDEEIKVTE